MNARAKHVYLHLSISVSVHNRAHKHTHTLFICRSECFFFHWIWILFSFYNKVESPWDLRDRCPNFDDVSFPVSSRVFVFPTPRLEHLPCCVPCRMQATWLRIEYHLSWYVLHLHVRHGQVAEDVESRKQIRKTDVWNQRRRQMQVSKCVSVRTYLCSLWLGSRTWMLCHSVRYGPVLPCALCTHLRWCVQELVIPCACKTGHKASKH